jgi:hypothetical protein
MISLPPTLWRRDSSPVVYLQGYDQRNSGIVIDHELNVLEELSINLRCQCVFCRCEDQLAAVSANTSSSGNQSGVGCISIVYLFERVQASAATRATSESVGHTLESRGPPIRMYLYRSSMGGGIFQVGFLRTNSFRPFHFFCISYSVTAISGSSLSSFCSALERAASQTNIRHVLIVLRS